jgi:hypothetical protein
MFLKMNLNGREYDWFSTLDVNKLQKFKQVVIKFVNNDSIDVRSRLFAFELLNETHYVVNLVVDGEVINVVYLRKDLVPNAVYVSETKLTIEIPEDDAIILNCPTPIPRAGPSPVPSPVPEDVFVAVKEVQDESVVPEVVEEVVDVVPEVVEEVVEEVVDVVPEVVEEVVEEVVDVVPEVVEEESFSNKKNKKNKNKK